MEEIGCAVLELGYFIDFSGKGLQDPLSVVLSLTGEYHRLHHLLKHTVLHNLQSTSEMVLIVEALTPEFGEKFWKFIVDGKYRNKATNGSNPQFYRFDKPEDDNFPKFFSKLRS